MASGEDAAHTESRAGDLSTGWGRLEIGVARAIFHTLGGNQGTVFWAVVERAWCYPWFRYRTGDPIPCAEPCKLNLAELARATGQIAECLNRAKRTLIRKGMLIEHEDGSLEPNKRYDVAAGLGLSSEMVAYCLDGASVMQSARAANEERTYRRPQPAVQKPVVTPVRSNPVPEKQSASALKVVSSEPEKQSASALVEGEPKERQRSDSVDQDRAPALRFQAPIPIREELKRERIPRMRASATEEDLKGNDFQGPRETIQQEMSRACSLMLGGCTPGPIEPDPVLLAKLDAKLNEWYPTADNIRVFIATHRRQVPTAHFMKLVKRLRVKNIPNPADGYLRTILRSWGAAGGPDHGPEDDYDDDLQLLAYRNGPVPSTRFEPPKPVVVEQVVDPEIMKYYRSAQKRRVYPAGSPS